MDYIREAEKVLYYYRDLKNSIGNMRKEIGRLMWSGAPDQKLVSRLEATGIKQGHRDETINVLFKIQVLQNSMEKTKEELSRIDEILETMDRPYGELLRQWYIERIPREQIAINLNYSRSGIFKLRHRAIRKFAVRLFGLEAIRAV